MADKKDEGKVIKLSDKVTVYGTGKATNMPLNAEVKVHPELAKKLIEAGKASDKKVAEKK